MDWLKLVHGAGRQDALPFSTGDDVRVWFKIREGGKERLAHFEGVVMRVRGTPHERTFTVRRVTFGEGVERMFPLDAKVIEKIEVLRRAKAHRSRIYFLRDVIKRTRLATDERTGKTSSADESKNTQSESQPEASPDVSAEATAVAAEKPIGSEAGQS